MTFGRFSDAYKSPENYRLWDAAMALFEEEKPLDAIESLLGYLKNAQGNNVFWERKPERLNFSLYQGSKKVHGLVADGKLKVEVRIANAQGFQIGWMRRLLEHNYELNYSSYALKDQTVFLTFDSALLDLTAYKFYFALKELATQADKQDDLLIGDFIGLEGIDDGHLSPFSQEVKDVKHAYFKQEVNEFLDFLKKTNLNIGHFQNGLSYLILNLVYKLDYVLVPQGRLMDKLENIHDQYFNSGLPDNESKNQVAIRILLELAEMSKERLEEELYGVIHTFGVVKPVGHDTIKTLIEGESKNLTWYMNQGHEDFVEAICGYIMGFAMFSYAPPKPLKDLFHLYVRIVEEDIMVSLGYPRRYRRKKKLDKRKIQKAITEITELHQTGFPRFAPETDFLDFNSLAKFGMSYLKMVHALDLTESQS